MTSPADVPNGLSTMNTIALLIPRSCHGVRLDQALSRLMPGIGRRGVRRFWKDGEVRVDGERRPAGFRVSAGQRVALGNLDAGQDDAACHGDALPWVQVTGRSADFAALSKPAGVHSQGLGGNAALSVEDVLPRLFPDNAAVLLNRLDRPVSGLLLVALTASAAENYAAWQDQGRVRKRYLAMVCGDLAGERLIRAALDTAKRRKVRVLKVDEPDALRWTRIRPCTRDAQREATLVHVEILKGRRHQIRAHLASIGHPVCQDPLYGMGPDLGWIALHHGEVELPGFLARSEPAWWVCAGLRERHAAPKAIWNGERARQNLGLPIVPEEHVQSRYLAGSERAGWEPTHLPGAGADRNKKF